jgi:cytochrome P450
VGVPGSSGALINLMDPQEHSRRRKAWERGLNISAVQDYGATLSIRVQQLVECLETRRSEIINISNWLSWLSCV